MTVDSDIVEVVKRVVKNAAHLHKYADILYVYGFYDGSPSERGRKQNMEEQENILEMVYTV